MTVLQRTNAQLAALRRHQVVETTQVAVAQRASSRLMSPNSMQMGRHRSFHFRVSAAGLSGCTLLGVDFRGSDPVLTADAPMDYYTVFVLLAGRITAAGRFGEAEVGPDEMFVFSPTECLRIHFADTAFLALKIPRRVLACHYSALTGRPLEGTLAFAPVVTNSSDAAPMRHQMHLAGAAVGRFADKAIATGLATALQNSLLTTLMMTQPSTHARHLLNPAESAEHDAVRHAAEIMRTEGHDLTLAQIAARAGLSTRSLQSGFRRVYGMTPSQFHRDARLDRAHRRLQQADPRAGVTVAEVAQDAGFAHLGRFSAEYRRRFGVLPSTTLRLL